MKKVIIMLRPRYGHRNCQRAGERNVVTDNGSEQPTLTKEVYPQKERTAICITG